MKVKFIRSKFIEYITSCSMIFSHPSWHYMTRCCRTSNFLIDEDDLAKMTYLSHYRKCSKFQTQYYIPCIQLCLSDNCSVWIPSNQINLFINLLDIVWFLQIYLSWVNYTQTNCLCKSGNFRENFIFANSVKRHIGDAKNLRLGHDFPI